MQSFYLFIYLKKNVLNALSLWINSSVLPPATPTLIKKTHLFQMLCMFYEQARPFFFQAPGNKLDLLSTSIMRGRQMQMIKKSHRWTIAMPKKCGVKKNPSNLNPPCYISHWLSFWWKKCNFLFFIRAICSILFVINRMRRRGDDFVYNQDKKKKIAVTLQNVPFCLQGYVW